MFTDVRGIDVYNNGSFILIQFTKTKHSNKRNCPNFVVISFIVYCFFVKRVRFVFIFAFN